MNDKHRLIDADSLLKNTKAYFRDCIDKQDSEIIDNTILVHNKNISKIIRRTPTVERPRGEWIEHEDAQGVWHYDCPFCDDGYATMEKCLSKPNYCHNCGADMRGEGE